MKPVEARHRRYNYPLEHWQVVQNNVQPYFEECWSDGHIDRYNVDRHRYNTPEPHIVESRVGVYSVGAKHSPYLMDVIFEQDDNHTYTRVSSAGNLFIVEGGRVQVHGSALDTQSQFQVAINKAHWILDFAHLDTAYQHIDIVRNRRHGYFDIINTTPASQLTTKDIFDPRHPGTSSGNSILRYDLDEEKLICDLDLSGNSFRAQIPLFYDPYAIFAVDWVLREKNLWQYPAKASPMGSLEVYYDKLPK